MKKPHTYWCMRLKYAIQFAYIQIIYFVSRQKSNEKTHTYVLLHWYAQVCSTICSHTENLFCIKADFLTLDKIVVGRRSFNLENRQLNYRSYAAKEERESEQKPDSPVWGSFSQLERGA